MREDVARRAISAVFIVEIEREAVAVCPLCFANISLIEDIMLVPSGRYNSRISLIHNFDWRFVSVKLTPSLVTTDQLAKNEERLPVYGMRQSVYVCVCDVRLCDF